MKQYFVKADKISMVIVALITGLIITLLFQPYIQALYLPSTLIFDLASTWKLYISTFISTLVYLLGTRKLVEKPCGSGHENKIEVHA